MPVPQPRLSQVPAGRQVPGPRDAWRAAAGFRGLWVAAVLLPLVGFGAAAWTAWRTVEAETRGRLARTVGMLHEHALRAFETQEAILIAVDGRVKGMGWTEVAASDDLHAFLRRLDDSTPSTAGVLLIAPDGRLAAASRLPVPAPQIDMADRDYWRAHLPEAGRQPPSGTFVGEVVSGRATGTPVFTLSQARSGPDGAPDGGVVGAAFEPEHFARFYAAIAEHPGDVALLARTDGAVLASHPPPPRPVGPRLPPEGEPARAFRGAGEELRLLRLRGLPPDGAERLVAFRRLGEGYPVVIAYGLSDAVPRRAWLARLAAPGLGMAGAAALLLWLTARAQHWARLGREEADQRAAMEAQLRRSEAGAALGQLAAGVAHDFGNAVQSVASGARLLERQAGDPAAARRLAGLIAGAAERGAALAGRMLAFARRGASDADGAVAAPLDIASSLAETAELLDRTLGSGCRVRCVLGSPPPPAALVDRAELETVVVNLAVNARDAMPQGGEITLEAAGEAAAPGSEAPGPAPSAYARVAVRDTGVGMDAETLARAGEAFFTTKPVGKGTGLGLSMARGFAARSGGALRIESAPGRGTVVTLWLPAAPAPPPGTAAPAPKGACAPARATTATGASGPP